MPFSICMALLWASARLMPAGQLLLVKAIDDAACGFDHCHHLRFSGADKAVMQKVQRPPTTVMPDRREWRKTSNNRPLMVFNFKVIDPDNWQPSNSQQPVMANNRDLMMGLCVVFPSRLSNALFAGAALATDVERLLALARIYARHAIWF